MRNDLPARDTRVATWSGLAGLAAGLGAAATWLCCLPFVAGTAGALAGVASVAWGLRPWLLGAAVAALAFGFWRAYRPLPCPEGECVRPGGRRRARVVLWLGTVVAILAFTFERWSGWALYQLL